MPRTHGMRRAGVVAWTLAVGTLAAPRPMLPVPGWVDGSWQVALDLVRRRHLHWGSGVIFTYGPVGFLNIAVPYFAGEWLAAVLAALAVEAGVVLCIAGLLSGARAPVWQWAVSGVCLVVAFHVVPPVESGGPVLVTLLLWSAVRSDRGGRTSAAFALCGGLAAGVLALVKASGVVSVIPMLVVFVLAGLIQRRRGLAALALAAFAATITGTWFAMGQRVGDVIPYAHAAVDVLRGYASAQWFWGITPGIVCGSLLVAGTLATTAWLLVRGRQVGVLMLMSSAVLVAQFKDSFVREGPERDATFFAVAAVLALAVMPSAWRGSVAMRSSLLSRSIRVGAAVAVVVLGVTWSCVVERTAAVAWPDVAGYRTAAQASLEPAVRRTLDRDAQAAAQAAYDALLPGVSREIGSRPVDVYPWDIGLVFAHPELHWQPRPVLSSYQAYTPWLDGLDARSLDGPSAPGDIVYRFGASDGQYPPFEEPAYFRQLLMRYRPLRSFGNDYLLMTRDGGTGSDRTRQSEGTHCAAFGGMVAIPQVADRWIFGAVSVTMSPLGSIVGSIWKPAGIDVHLRAGRSVSSYRFSPGDAGDGLYLSTLLGSADDMAAAQGGQGAAPGAIGLSTSAPWEYGGGYCVSFYSIPRPPA